MPDLSVALPVPLLQEDIPRSKGILKLFSLLLSLGFAMLLLLVPCTQGGQQQTPQDSAITMDIWPAKLHQPLWEHMQPVRMRQPSHIWHMHPARSWQSLQVARAGQFIDQVQKPEPLSEQQGVVGEPGERPSVVPGLMQITPAVTRRNALAIAAPMAWKAAAAGVARADPKVVGKVSFKITVDPLVTSPKGTEVERFRRYFQDEPLNYIPQRGGEITGDDKRTIPKQWSDVLRWEVDNSERAPVSAQRVLELAQGIADGGGGFRRASIDYVDPAFVRVGQKNIGTLGDTSERAAAGISGGMTGMGLLPEIDETQVVSDYDVLLIAPTVGNDDADTEEKLVSRDGKFVTQKTKKKGVAARPNGTGLIFVIDAKAVPAEFLKQTVRVGRVTDASSKNLLQELGNLPKPEINEALLQAGANAGDGRALFARLRAGRPLALVKIETSTRDA